MGVTAMKLMLAQFTMAVSYGDRMDLSAASLSTPELLPSAHEEINSLLSIVRERSGLQWPVLGNAERKISLEIVETLSGSICVGKRQARWSYSDQGSYAIYTTRSEVRVVAKDVVGLRAAVRRFLRQLIVTHGTQFQIGRIQLDKSICILSAGAESERWRTRGHQVGQNHHPVFFRDVAGFTEYMTDLKVFGTNQIEVAHVVAADPAFVQGLANMSSIVHSLGMNFSVWVNAGLKQLPDLIAAAPYLNSLFFPGGDGGSLDWPTIQSAAGFLHSKHPEAQVPLPCLCSLHHTTVVLLFCLFCCFAVFLFAVLSTHTCIWQVWVSAQELNKTQLAEFMATVGSEPAHSYLVQCLVTL
jgi:hypothetical protein